MLDCPRPESQPAQGGYHGNVHPAWRCSLALIASSAFVCARWYAAPAGSRPALKRPAASILPGGRIIAPAGAQFETGPGPFGLAVSASGNAVVTANAGPDVSSLTILERSKAGAWQARQLPAAAPNAAGESGDTDWRSVSSGVVLSGEHAAFVAEGASGRVSLLDWTSARRRAIDLNQGGFHASFTGDLALDAAGGFLYVADQANSRVAVIETRSRGIIASAPVGGPPSALALSPDRRKLYVAGAGMADAGGHTPQSNSLSVVDVADPTVPKVEAVIPAGLPPESGSADESSPPSVLAAGGRVFVSNTGSDSITVIDAATNQVESEIAIRIPGFENLRGALPTGMAYHEASGRLLVAEAGINAVAVIDPRERRVLGHIPAGWSPTRVAVHGDTVFVANGRGSGSGPNAPFGLAVKGPGSVSIYPMPGAEELAAGTGFVMEANGFRERPGAEPPIPSGLRRAVLIVKGNRTYDEVLGDIPEASNGPAMMRPEIARFGSRGYVDGKRQRLSILDIAVTPNHHSIAWQWAFSDNFYADADVTVDGRRRPVGILSATAPAEQPRDGAIWRHLERHGVSSRNFGEGVNMNIPDQDRASQFIREIEERYIKTGADLPRFLYIHLPNDRMAEARPADGYPYEESFVADNDLALGRIVEFLSGTKWWKEMAVFVTEDDTQGGVDHIDARRTVLLCAGPWVKQNYVSHANAGFPGLLKTIFRILGTPPLNLLDAAATDLSDLFTAHPGDARYRAVAADARIFVPAQARQSRSSTAPGQ
jgi:YVTN family beta-propeller protein